MIDLHCHLIPGIDDGAATLDEALEMARIAVADGIIVTACTSHIFPGMFNNNGNGIREGMAKMQRELDAHNIPLRLVIGADVQLDLGILGGLKSGGIPSLNDSRYFLFEPPHVHAPIQIEAANKSYVDAGYVPIITHPERLKWIEGGGYDRILQMVDDGAWIQLTAGSLTGMFGGRAKYWCERMLDDGVVHIIATDAHNVRRRTPILSKARDAVAARLGEEEAWRMVRDRPQAVLDDLPPDALPPPSMAAEVAQKAVLAMQAAPESALSKPKRRSFWPFG
jgi:protein-tyrosine phosphatase